MKRSALLAAAGFTVLTLTASVTTVTVPAQAQYREDCRERVEHAERHLYRMIERFGRRSPQAREARYELERARERCERRRHRDHHGWDR
jgi:hypothetical protein